MKEENSKMYEPENTNVVRYISK